MTATTPETTAVQGAPRRLVEDAWKAMNRRYALGTLVLLAALLLLWLTGNGPGAWRAAAIQAPPPVAASGGTPGGAPVAAPAPSAPASAPVGAGAAKSAAAPTPAAPSAKAPPVAAPGGSAANGGPAAPATGPGAAGATAPPAAGGGAASPAPGAARSSNGEDAGLPRALAGAPVARLYFGPDQAWPSGRVGPVLAPVLARLKEEPDTKALVSGFHDRRGSPERNADLALRRAQSVRRVLIREGVPADRIVLARPQQSQGSGPDREARRVEVTVAR